MAVASLFVARFRPTDLTLISEERVDDGVVGQYDPRGMCIDGRDYYSFLTPNQGDPFVFTKIQGYKYNQGTFTKTVVKTITPNTSGDVYLGVKFNGRDFFGLNAADVSAKRAVQLIRIGSTFERNVVIVGESVGADRWGLAYDGRLIWIGNNSDLASFVVVEGHRFDVKAGAISLAGPSFKAAVGSQDNFQFRFGFDGRHFGVAASKDDIVADGYTFSIYRGASAPTSSYFLQASHAPAEFKTIVDVDYDGRDWCVFYTAIS